MNPGYQEDDRRITYFAATHTRGKHEMFGIRAVDRSKHIYVIGKTGMGKSTMLENLAIQDIQNGEGICFIDPHGSTAEKLLDFVPHDRINDVIYFAPFDTDHPVGFNVMEDVGYDKRHLVVSGLMGALKRIWVDAWSARMEYILQNTLLALLEYPGSTLLDVNRMLTNKNFRNAVIEKITDPIVKAFWTDEFANFTDTYTREATPAIQNKIGQFTANPLIRNIVGQPTSSFDLRKAMDTRKIFIVNLSKGRMGETNASLLGSMLTVKIYLASMSRADEPAARMAKLPRCYFYVDEFQSMMNEAFADILSESRKYKLALTLANQYIEQMEEEVRDAVFGNVGTLVTFRVGPFDAEVLKTVFEPTFEAEDLVGLGVGQIYLTLMIDGVGSAPFSAQTIPPIEAPRISYREDVVTQSREKYARPRAEVEAVINQKQSEYVMPPPAPKEKKWGGASKAAPGSTYGTRPREEKPPFPILPPNISKQVIARPSEQRDEAGTFDRRTGEFVRREEESNDRVYVPPARPTPPAPQVTGPTDSSNINSGQVAPRTIAPTPPATTPVSSPATNPVQITSPHTPPVHATTVMPQERIAPLPPRVYAPPPVQNSTRPPHAVSVKQQSEEEKRNALRAAISLAGRASAAPTKINSTDSTSLPRSGSGQAAGKSPAEMLRDRVSGGNGPRTSPQSPIRIDRPQSVVPRSAHQPTHYEPRPHLTDSINSLHSGPGQVERSSHSPQQQNRSWDSAAPKSPQHTNDNRVHPAPPRQESQLAVPPLPSAPVPPTQQYGTGEVSKEVLQRLLNGDKDE